MQAGLIERPNHRLQTFRGEAIQKRYWTVGEVAAIAGMETSAVRYYAAELDLLVDRGNVRRERHFRKWQVELILKANLLSKYMHLRGVVRLANAGFTKVDQAIELFKIKVPEVTNG